MNCLNSSTDAQSIKDGLLDASGIKKRLESHFCRHKKWYNKSLRTTPGSSFVSMILKRYRWVSSRSNMSSYTRLSGKNGGGSCCIREFLSGILMWVLSVDR